MDGSGKLGASIFLPLHFSHRHCLVASLSTQTTIKHRDKESLTWHGLSAARLTCNARCLSRILSTHHHLHHRGCEGSRGDFPHASQPSPESYPAHTTGTRKTDESRVRHLVRAFPDQITTSLRTRYDGLAKGVRANLRVIAARPNLPGDTTSSTTCLTSPFHHPTSTETYVHLHSHLHPPLPP